MCPLFELTPVAEIRHLGGAQTKAFTKRTGLSQGHPALSGEAPLRTKTRFEIHTGCCRVRRNRKRLTSNGSIESDAAVGPHGCIRSIAPRHFR